MKSSRLVLLIAGIGIVIGIGGVGYAMFLGPERIEFAGKSFPELVESGALLAILVIPVVLIIAAVAFIPFFRILFPSEIKNGVTAQARVVRVWDTGVSINANPQVGLLLEVSPPGGAVFQAEAKTVVSRLNVGLVQPGVTAEVRYDPQQPTRLQIISLDLGEGPGGRTAGRLEELNELRDRRLITEEEYRTKREEVLKNL